MKEVDAHIEKKCIECSVSLELIKRNPYILCGGLVYFQCPQCKSFFGFGEVGIIGAPVYKKVDVGTVEELEVFMKHDYGD